MREGKVPGVFVAIVKNDSVLFRKGYGVADSATGISVTGKTCMELGSISKAFTNEAILYLYRRQLLNLDDPITKYLPGAPARWSGITIRNLRDHTSGIKNYLLDPRFMAGAVFNYSPSDNAARFFLNSITTDSMLSMFYSLPLEFYPGATWSYSNTAYYLLGKIGEKVSGKHFFDLVEEVVTVPLNMLQTKANEEAASEGCLLQGHYISCTGIKRAPILSSNYAFSAGAWTTSGDDMINYMKAIHLKNLPSLKAGEDWRKYSVNNELPFNYNLGHFHSIYHGKHYLSHNGGTPGYSSSWIYVVEDSISIIVLANRQDYAPIDQLARNLLTLYEPDLNYPDDPVKNEQVEKYEMLIREILEAIQYDKSLPMGLSKPMQLYMDSENGRGLWKWIFERGYPEKIYCVDTEVMGKTKAYRFRTPPGSKIQYLLTVIFNKKNELTQMLWW